MPVEWIEADGPEGLWRLSGRVLARPAAGLCLLGEDTHRIQVQGPALDAVEEGDLVQIRAVIDPSPAQVVLPVDAAFPAYRAVSAEVVFRPSRPPTQLGSETRRFVTDGQRARLHLRAQVLQRVRDFFRTHGFLEVETPSVVESPGLDTHLSAFPVLGAQGGGLLGLPKQVGYLITSPEYCLKRLLVGGVSRCFELARCFRAGELGARHQPEFTLCEWYRAWGSLEEVLQDAEGLVRAASAAGQTPGRVVTASGSVSLAGRFPRMTVREAFARWAPDAGDPIALAGSDEGAYFEALTRRIEPNLGLLAPTFLTEVPACHASLARVSARDPAVCERAELYIAGVELSNGFQELTDPAEQRARFEADQARRSALGLPVYPVDEAFLGALEEGLPPSAGMALGVDRLVALVGGRGDIADVQAFPRQPR
ncbi:MAG: EF-P lysine aminoacylase GenX [Deltaproteobacteria bacterium]|nr:EF-P lysine aminoacylase GenX [Deltaproteobacteria bacterium]